VKALGNMANKMKRVLKTRNGLEPNLKKTRNEPVPSSVSVPSVDSELDVPTTDVIFKHYLISINSSYAL